MRRLTKTIAVILCLVMAVGSLAFADEVQPISAKVKDYEGHWAQATIQKWIDEGRVSGYTDGSYKPDNNVTRAEFVKMVNGIVDFDGRGKASYTDVPATEWYYDYIGIAQEIGYISGYTGGEFRPNAYITREQAALMLARIQYLDSNAAGIDKFSDKKSISSWAAEAVGAASEAGFITGYSDKSFGPSKNLTRAEAITMLDNVLNNAKNHVIFNAGTKIENFVFDGDLVIAATVGEGDVTLNNVTVNGALKVLGGGENSLYFNNVKVDRVVVSKEGVRLVLGNGTEIQEVELTSETILENTDGSIAKIVVNGDGTVTLKGKFDEVEVNAEADIVLDNATVTKLVAEKPIVIKGTGTITTLEANADDIIFWSKVDIKKSVVGEGVKTPPAKQEETPSGGNGGSSGGGNGDDDDDEEYSRVINLKVELNDENDSTKSKELEYTTEEYSDDDVISYFIKDAVHDIIYDEKLETTLTSLLNSMNARVENVKINDQQVYSETGWEKLTSYFEGTSYLDEDLYDETQYSGLRDKDLVKELLDGIDIKDLQNLDYTFKDNLEYAENDIEIVNDNLEDYPFDEKEVSYNNKPVTYSISVEGKTLDTNKEVADFVLSKLTLTNQKIVEFFEEYGDIITITIDADGFNGEITITNKELIK